MSQETRRHGEGCDAVEVGPALIDVVDEEVGVWFAYRSSASVGEVALRLAAWVSSAVYGVWLTG